MRYFFFFFFKQKTAYELRISDWSSDVCSSDLHFSDFIVDGSLCQHPPYHGVVYGWTIVTARLARPSDRVLDHGFLRRLISRAAMFETQGGCHHPRAVADFAQPIFVIDAHNPPINALGPLILHGIARLNFQPR